MDYDSCRSLPAMFFEQAERRGEKPFLWAKRDGRYQPTGWAEAAREVRRLARGLTALGVRRGDRVGARRREPAGMGRRRSRDHERRGDHGAGLCDQHRRRPSPRLRHQRRARRDRVEACPVGAGVGGGQSGRHRPHGDRDRAHIRARRARSTSCRGATCSLRGDEAADRRCRRRVAELTPDDIACLIFTSGTGGVPKGVMTTHRNILANCRGAFRLLETLGPRRRGVFELSAAVAFLRAHRRADVPDLDRGADLFRRRGRDPRRQPARSAADDHDRGAAALRDAAPPHHCSGSSARAGWRARCSTRRWRSGASARRSARPSLGERLIDPLLDRSVRAGVRRRFGGRLKAMVSGGAPLNPEIGSFFLALGVRLLQGYGQTEAAPVIACNVAVADQDRHGRAAARRGARCGSPRTAKFWSRATMS